MTAVLMPTAQAVVDELNTPTGHTWSLSFVAERNFGDWTLPLEESEDETRVDVFPLESMPTELETQGSVEYKPTIAVVVRYKFRQADSDEDTGRPIDEIIEEHVALLEEINEHFATRRLGDAAWDSSVIIPIRVEHLTNPRQYTGLVRLTYRVQKEL